MANKTAKKNTSDSHSVTDDRSGPVLDDTCKDSDGPFPVVGIGASAGGLQALQSFFSKVPVDSGMTFIVVQHLDPSRESLTAEILSRFTQIPILQVADHPKVRPDTAYIIPPNKTLTIKQGRLYLSERDEKFGSRITVDTFFRSLAQDQKQCAAGIILSGTGTDGTLGIKAIKQHGGLVIIQKPETAEHPGMPRSALATGVADFVLPPGEMPAALVNYRNQPELLKDHPAEEIDADSDTMPPEDDLESILTLVKVRTKHDFRSYKSNTLVRRIQRRMGLRHLSQRSEYLSLLKRESGEVESLVKDLLISVTDFFRDDEPWRELTESVIAPLVRRKSDDEPIRVWVAGCATGEEPYSLAMIIFEQLHLVHKSCQVQIFASDIDRSALEYARHGLYPVSIENDVSPARLKRFFTKVNADQHYQVAKILRDAVIFAEQNLIGDPPFSRLDLICCRNVLIYLKPKIQEKVIAMFHFALLDGGTLFLGNSETIGRQEALFETSSKRWRIYRRIGQSRNAHIDLPLSSSPARRMMATIAPTDKVEFRITSLAQQQLLNLLAPSAVVVDHAWRIRYICGDIDDYLTHSTGVPTDDLLAKSRQGLRTKLRGAVHTALSKKHEVTFTTRIRQAASHFSARVIVHPFRDREDGQELVLVLFERLSEEAVPASALGAGGGAASHGVEDEAVIRQLEDELAATKEDLQASVEQLETSNEEYKAANEEIMSINEELQSTNEELETSKEELQSLNEELTTLNNQLTDKVEELETNQTDMNNLLIATEVATICLDTDLRVRWFTPAASRLIRLADTDKGRPLSDLAHDFVVTDLVPICDQVLRQLLPAETEVAASEGRTFLRRIGPYRTENHRIGGVVITFVDITRLKNSEEALRQSEEQLRTFNHRLEQQVAERIELFEILQDVAIYCNHANSVEQALSDAMARVSEHEGSALAHAFEVSRRGHVESSGIWHVGTVLSQNEETELLIEEFQHASENCLPEECETWIRNVIETRRPGFLSSLNDLSPERKKYAKSLGLVNAIAFPILVEDEVLAVMEFFSLESPHRPDAFFATMQNVGAQIGQVYERRRLQEAITEATHELKRHFGRELHDNIAQELTGLTMMGQTIAEQLARDEIVGPKVSQLIGHLRRVHDQVRRLARGLMPVEIDGEGLVQSLHELASNSSEMYHLKCVLESPESVELPDQNRRTHLYRIVQEAIQNAAVHGRPKHIWLSLVDAADSVQLTIRDDGRGYDSSRPTRGMGLRIMKYRANLIGGDLHIQSSVGNGTVIQCHIPKY